jgi:hypothetical protein
MGSIFILPISDQNKTIDAPHIRIKKTTHTVIWGAVHLAELL